MLMQTFLAEVANAMTAAGFECKAEATSLLALGRWRIHVTTYKTAVAGTQVFVICRERISVSKRGNYNMGRITAAIVREIGRATARAEQQKAQEDERRRLAKGQDFARRVAAGGERRYIGGDYAYTASESTAVGYDGTNYIVHFTTRDPLQVRRAVDLLLLLEQGGEYDGRDLLSTVLSAPEDDVVGWMVYADWLEERGQIERAQKIREAAANA